MSEESDLSKWHKTILSLKSENQKLTDLLEIANANSLGYAKLANEYLDENQKLRQLLRDVIDDHDAKCNFPSTLIEVIKEAIE